MGLNTFNYIDSQGKKHQSNLGRRAAKDAQMDGGGQGLLTNGPGVYTKDGQKVVPVKIAVKIGR